jgi:glycosyltransferase involved in cell wall biosynthesis
MKILVIPSWYPPQGGMFFKEQVEVLANYGHEVDVIYTEYISLKNAGFNDFFTESKIQKNNITEWRTKYVKLPKLFKFNQLQHLKKHTALVKKYFYQGNKPDLIYGQSAIWGGYIGSIFANAFEIPLIIQEQRGRFLANNKYAKELRYDWQISYAKESFESANEILLLTNQMKPTISEIAPNHQANIRIIPNMVDTDFFNVKENKPSNTFRFLTVARLDKYKGIDVLIRSLNNLIKEGKDVELEIVGSGEELENLKNLAQKFGIENSVFFSGQKNREGVKNALHNCHAFVLPTLFDTFPLVALEALSTGTPIVGTHSGGLSDIINNDNGYICESGNSDKLKASMLLMIENYSNFNSEKIRNLALEKYHKKIVGSQLNDIFSKYK